MIKKNPISAAKLPIADILASLGSLFNDNKAVLKLRKRIRQYYGIDNVFFLNSGLSCLYAILAALKTTSIKNEVILPAYTAGSLIVAVKKAGLVPVLCEVSPEDFNLDTDFLDKVISENTLCVIAVHMFGVAARGIEELTKKYPDIVIIEDVCQSMGTTINSKPVGDLGKISFFSLNKGKNFSTFGGGFILTGDKGVADKIDQQVAKAGRLDFKRKLEIFIRLIILSIVMNPFIYGMFYSIIERFKEITPPQDIDLKAYTGLQANLAEALIRNMETESKKRYENGMRLIAGLISEKQLILPQISENSKPAFNRLPVVFRDLKKRQRVEICLTQAGIETSRMYLKPLHHMFDLNYAWGNFPNAVYLAGHLLTLPCHPLLKQSDIDKIIKIIKNA